jgi:hypothetical protein
MPPLKAQHDAPAVLSAAGVPDPCFSCPVCHVPAQNIAAALQAASISIAARPISLSLSVVVYLIRREMNRTKEKKRTKRNGKRRRKTEKKETSMVKEKR